MNNTDDSKTMHVIVVPLEANQRDIQIVGEALQIVGKLRNAALGEMLGRIDHMKNDLAWRENMAIEEKRAKNKAYSQLKKDYGVTSHDMVRICHAHWKASGWMGERLGARIAISLASELWQNLEEYIYKRARRPRFKASEDRDMVWNNDNLSGLLLRDNHVLWSTKTKRKNLNIPLKMSAMSNPRREWLATRLGQGALRRVGIQREVVRGETRLFAHICLRGAPYRSEEYLDQIGSYSTDLVGLDLGPTWLAVVSKEEAKELPIATLERIKQDNAMRLKERNLKRAVDRSRAANNKHARRKDGRSIRGVKQPHRSKRGQQRQQWLADTKRRDRINRQKDRSQAVRSVMQCGVNIAIEGLNYKAWQRSLFGRRMLITSPGDFTDRLVREAELLGGSVTIIDPWKAKVSQTCLCGEHTGKKELKERTHYCPSCGLEAHRDMVSAALVRELGLADEQVWDKGLAEARLQEGVPPEWRLVEQASRTKHAATEAILSPCRTPLSMETTAGNCGVKQSTADSLATALLCEKQTSDPVDKNRKSNIVRSSHVPTCEKPAMQRLGASQKATVKKANPKASAHPERLL